MDQTAEARADYNMRPGPIRAKSVAGSKNAGANFTITGMAALMDGMDPARLVIRPKKKH